METPKKAVKSKVTREEAAAQIELGVELKKKKKTEREKINSSSLLEAGGIESKV